MKRTALAPFIVMLLICNCAFAKKGERCSESEHCIFEVIDCHNGPVLKKGDPGTKDNKYGFEGGRVFKFKGQYHMFTSECFGDPMWVKMKLAHWKSPDGIKWERVSTLYESSGDYTGKDPRTALWSPMPFYNEKESRWNLTYVAYRSKPKCKKWWTEIRTPLGLIPEGDNTFTVFFTARSEAFWLD